LIKTRDGQRGKHIYSTLKHPECLSEGIHLIEIGAFDGRGVRLSPMRSHRVPRPDRTDFTCCVVADCEDKIELRRAGLGEFVPSLASKAFGWQVFAIQQRQRQGMDRSLGMAPRAEGLEPAVASVVSDGFGEDAASGISGTQEQHVVHAISHSRPRLVTNISSCRLQTPGTKIETRRSV
jgi:hypothetical protein